jgi:hypothetical protein
MRAFLDTYFLQNVLCLQALSWVEVVSPNYTENFDELISWIIPVSYCLFFFLQGLSLVLSFFYPLSGALRLGLVLEFLFWFISVYLFPAEAMLHVTLFALMEAMLLSTYHVGDSALVLTLALEWDLLEVVVFVLRGMYSFIACPSPVIFCALALSMIAVMWLIHQCRHNIAGKGRARRYCLRYRPSFIFSGIALVHNHLSLGRGRSNIEVGW